MIGILSVIAISVASYFEAYPQESQSAVDYVSMHKKEIKVLTKFLSKEDARLAMCIVAPEISQYSTVSDAAETFALYTLYVQGQISNFSIGEFQMKPSFAVSIEDEVLRYDYLSKYRTLIIDKIGERAIRYERVERLSSLKWQLIYLAAFFEIAKRRTNNTSFKTPEEKLKYFATLYNAGINVDENRVYYFYDIDGFPKYSSQSFNYGDICIEFYKHKNYCSFFK